jgi:tetratricopeptide (TPR) repeat protein
MSRLVPPLESLVLTLMRRRRGRTEEELGDEAEITSQQVSNLEVGRRDLSRERLEELAGFLSFDAADVDQGLVSLQWLYADEEPALPVSPVDPTPRELRVIARAVAGIVAALTALIEGSVIAELRARRARRDRRRAERHLQVLLRQPEDRRRLIVEKVRPYQTWALAERLAHASEDAASDSADKALDLARLACRVAELAPGGEVWRSRLRGYCLAFRANALRVRNDLDEAEADFTEAKRLWEAGAPADRGVLAVWRMLDLEVSLCRDRQRFDQALKLADCAREAAPREMVGRVLVKKAVVLEHMGEFVRAIDLLHDAASLVDGRGDPRLPCVLRFNLIANFCNLDRFTEAEALLPETRRMVFEGRRKLDLARLTWITGRVAAGQRREAEARAAFEQARREFRDRNMAADYALVSLELATLDLEQGRTAQVRRLASEMAWIFCSKGIHREAHAALDLFCRAAAQEAASVELARRLVRYLYRARYDPTLTFEA